MTTFCPEKEKNISGAGGIDEKESRTHLDGLARLSVEDTRNALLNAEADRSRQAPASSLVQSFPAEQAPTPNQQGGSKPDEPVLLPEISSGNLGNI